jgi:hypothetical protein
MLPLSGAFLSIEPECAMSPVVCLNLGYAQAAGELYHYGVVVMLVDEQVVAL